MQTPIGRTVLSQPAKRQCTAYRTLTFSSSMQEHDFLCVTRAMKVAGKCPEVEFPTLNTIKAVEAKLAHDMVQLGQVEMHLKEVNAILGELYNSETHPTQWGARCSKAGLLEFESKSAGGHAYRHDGRD